MFSNFNEEAQKILVLSKKEMTELKHPYVGSEHLLLAILSNTKLDITKKLANYQINYKKFKEEIISVIGIGSEANQWFLYTPLLKRILETAILDAKENNEGEVTVEHLFLALLEEGEGVAIRVLLGMNVDVEGIYQDFSTKVVEKKGKSKKKLLIEDFAVDFNKKAINSSIDPVIGREEEINRVVEILSRRTKNNPLLLGEAGVGKTSIVEELANRIINNQIPKNLKNKRILSLSMASLVAGTKYRGEFEERIGKILKEVENNDDIILFIDEIHTLVGAGGAEGAIDASNILKPALARGKIRLIGATTTQEYKECMEKDKALGRRFQVVNIKEPDHDKVKAILEKLKPIYESFHGVVVPDDVLNLLIDLSDRYIYDRKQPDKAIDILDEVCAKVSLFKDSFDEKIEKLNIKLQNIKEKKNEAIIKQDFVLASSLKDEEQNLEDKKNKLELEQVKNGKVRHVTKEMIAEVIHLKTQIPVYELMDNNNESLVELEKKLKQKIIGQDEVIHTLCNVTKRMKLGYDIGAKPHSFLFVGSTGLGKTLLAKKYAEYLFGKENFIRLDMSEFKESHSISKIVGSPPGYVGYSDYKNLLENIKSHPHSVLLLDEIEKAHPSVLNLFLQALDEGRLTDSKGNLVRFDHVSIIMTSNIGCNKETVGFSNDSKKVVSRKLNEILTREFINRIDDILIFNKLTEKNIKEIIKLKLEEVCFRFEKRNIKFRYNASLIDELVKISKYEEFGARRIDKIIAEKVDLFIIDRILEGQREIKLDHISA